MWQDIPSDSFQDTERTNRIHWITHLRQTFADMHSTGSACQLSHPDSRGCCRAWAVLSGHIVLLKGLNRAFSRARDVIWIKLYFGTHMCTFMLHGCNSTVFKDVSFVKRNSGNSKTLNAQQEWRAKIPQTQLHGNEYFLGWSWLPEGNGFDFKFSNSQKCSLVV